MADVIMKFTVSYVILDYKVPRLRYPASITFLALSELFTHIWGIIDKYVCLCISFLYKKYQQMYWYKFFSSFLLCNIGMDISPKNSASVKRLSSY